MFRSRKKNFFRTFQIYCDAQNLIHNNSDAINISVFALHCSCNKFMSKIFKGRICKLKQMVTVATFRWDGINNLAATTKKICLKKQNLINTFKSSRTSDYRGNWLASSTSKNFRQCFLNLFTFKANWHVIKMRIKKNILQMAIE